MSTRKTFAYSIAGRARRLGWPVEQTDSGVYKIKCPDDFVVQVHLSPSDVNAPKAVMKMLNDHGFAEAETAWNIAQEQERQERLRTDQEKAAEKIQRVAEHARAINRAAGEYGTKEVTFEEILQPHPVPITFAKVLVTKTLADKLLDLNTDNRPIRRSDVEHWKSVLESGNWRYTHQGIALDNRSALQDGQHRLTAISESGIPALLQINGGMPPENYPVIDTGRRRSYGDVLSKEGYHDTTRLGAMGRLLFLYDLGGTSEWNRRVTNDEVREKVAEATKLVENTDNGENPYFVKALYISKEMYKSFRIITTPAAVGTFLLWREVGVDNPKVNEFLEGLRTGANLGYLDPRLALRRMIGNSTGRRDQIEHLALFLKAWKSYAEGRETRLAKWGKSERMPKVFRPE